MIKNVLDYLNSIPGLPCKVSLEMLGKKAPAMCLQQLPGEETVEAYINGDRECRLPFSLYLRISGKDTKSRIDAFAVFRAVEDKAKQDKNKGVLPFDDFRMVQLPALFDRQENGVEDYQAIFHVDYYEERMR